MPICRIVITESDSVIRDNEHSMMGVVNMDAYMQDCDHRK